MCNYAKQLNLDMTPYPDDGNLAGQFVQSLTVDGTKTMLMYYFNANNSQESVTLQVDGDNENIEFSALQNGEIVRH